MDAKFEFTFLHSGYSTVPVAIHPQPIGVVQLIGDAFVGTYPTFFYRYLIRKLFEQGYTVIAFPFRFGFNHWPIVFRLLQEQTGLRQALFNAAQTYGYEAEIYAEDPKLGKANYFWVGHGLGCKYIALLEILTDAEFRTLRDVFGRCVTQAQYQQITASLESLNLTDLSIKNQPSVFIAPNFSSTTSAIPLPDLALLLEESGAGATPTLKQTHCLTQRSRLFGLTALISFTSDTLAAPTVKRLLRHLPGRLHLRVKLRGGHRQALGSAQGDPQLAEILGRLLQLLAQAVKTAHK